MEPEEIIPTVPKSDNPAENRCPVCKEDFIEVYKDDDDEEEAFYLENAVRPHGPGSNAYHPECYEQYLIALDQNSSAADEMSQVEGSVQVYNSRLIKKEKNLLTYLMSY